LLFSDDIATTATARAIAARRAIIPSPAITGMFTSSNTIAGRCWMLHAKREPFGAAARRRHVHDAKRV
jgi:hypothetical protein